jgi:excisionase family DNA binding protein
MTTNTANKTHTPTLVDTDHLAKKFGVTPTTVRRWALNEGCPAIIVGGVYRFDEAEVDRWVQERTRERIRAHGKKQQGQQNGGRSDGQEQ